MDNENLAKKAFAERDEAKRKLRMANEALQKLQQSQLQAYQSGIAAGIVGEAWISLEASITSQVDAIKEYAERHGKFVSRLDCTSPIVRKMREAGSTAFEESSSREKRTNGRVGSFGLVDIYIHKSLSPILPRPKPGDGSQGGDGAMTEAMVCSRYVLEFGLEESAENSKDWLVRFYMDDMGIPPWPLETTVLQKDTCFGWSK